LKYRINEFAATAAAGSAYTPAIIVTITVLSCRAGLRGAAYLTHL
jgi:hypothetical protein